MTVYFGNRKIGQPGKLWLKTTKIEKISQILIKQKDFFFFALCFVFVFACHFVSLAGCFVVAVVVVVRGVFVGR